MIFVRIFFAENFIPLGGFGHAVVFVEKINRVLQKIPVGVADVVAVLLVLGHQRHIGVVDLGDQVQVRLQRGGLGERIVNDAPVVKRLEHGLVNDAAQRDQIIGLHLVGMLLRLLSRP